MEIKKSENRLEFIEILRFISIICVVIIHSLGCFNGTPHGVANWWFFNILNSLTHFCVPIFVMISGTLLLKNEIVLIPFLKKRLSRILFPFLFWSLILFGGNMFLKRPLSQSTIITSFFADIVNANINPIYWFIYMLLGLYLIAPIINKWIMNCKMLKLSIFC